MATLDRNRPFGTSIGDPTHSYVQDGKRFNGQGKEVDETGKLVSTKTTVTPPEKKPAKTAANEQTSE
jgi:hypothetical protein